MPEDPTIRYEAKIARLKKTLHFRTFLLIACGSIAILLCTFAGYLFVDGRGHLYVLGETDGLPATNEKPSVIAYAVHEEDEERILCRLDKILWAAERAKTEYSKGDLIDHTLIRKRPKADYGEGRVLLFTDNGRRPFSSWSVYDGNVMYSEEITVEQLVQKLKANANP